MGCSWLVHPLPLRERVGRGVAPASSTLRTRRLVVPSPSPGLRPPSPAGEGFSPFSPGRRCRAAADEGETPVLPTPLTRIAKPPLFSCKKMLDGVAPLRSPNRDFPSPSGLLSMPGKLASFGIQDPNPSTLRNRPGMISRSSQEGHRPQGTPHATAGRRTCWGRHQGLRTTFSWVFWGFHGKYNRII